MREMHKWKDKVELSLDNRQIFFLFFGLSVVGCFVFALGVMTGRRVDWGTTGEVAALDEDGDAAMALLDPDSVRERLSFKDGLAVSAAEGLPPTRDPESVGVPEDDQAEAHDDDAALASAAAAPKPAKPAADKPGKGGNKASDDDADDADDADDSKGDKASAAKPKPQTKLVGKFTLQMKAFSRADQAEAFANDLRSNGHDVRVEAHEVKGRIWHRVRVGAFKTWNEGLAAKDQFEKKESMIAYVVRL